MAVLMGPDPKLPPKETTAGAEHGGMELEDDLSLFVAIVEGGSIQAAANQFGLPRATASKRITRMEKRLGIRLLNRHSRAISLTPAGEIYFRHGRQALRSLGQAHRAVSAMAEYPSGTLRITCAEMIGQHVVMRRVNAFLQQFPKVRVELSLSDRIEDIVSAGYDMAIRMGEQPDSSLITRKLFSARRVICASPHYIEAFGLPNTPDELDRHNCVTMLTLGSRVNEWTFQQDGQVRRISVRGSFATNSGASNYLAIVQGIGIGRITNLPGLDDLRTGRLVRVLADYEVPVEAPIYALMPSNRNANPALRMLIDHLGGAP